MIRTSMSIASLALLLSACERETPAPQAPPASAEAPTTVATVEPQPALELDSIAVEEQFEAEAETQVNAANLAATLDELEKEIDAQ